MADISVKEGGKLLDFQVLFNSVDEVYFSNNILTNEAAINALSEVDMEFPVLEGGVTFDTGTAEVTEVKLTTGAIWVTKTLPGDSDISFQVASVAGPINNLLMSKKGTGITTTSTIEGKTYKGNSYSLAPKTVTGSLIMCAEDKQTIIILPNVTLISNFVGPDDTNPAYFNVAVTPKENGDGASIAILERQEDII